MIKLNVQGHPSVLFFRAAITKDHKPGGFKQCKFVFSQFCLEAGSVK